MTTTETAPRRRGPYRPRPRLQVKDTEWKPGDVLRVGRVRWIIASISGGVRTKPEERDVVLHSSNTVNHLVEWRTKLSILPAKPSKETR